ncbi:MAG: ATP-NAD kinase [Halobacteriales archaeon]
MAAGGEQGTVGVVGPADPVEDSLTDTERAVVRGSAEAVREAAPDWVLAVGEAALVDLVAAGVDRPVLPVGVAAAVRPVPRDRADAAIRSVLAGNATTRERTLLSVAVDHDPVGRALLDVALVTDVPARISEFGVEAGGDPVARFRADGVVVATPAGSVGYARDAGGPILSPGTESVGVVPISPFATEADHWVLRDESVVAAPHREEAVAVVVDGRKRQVIGAGESVSMAADGRLAILSVPEAGPAR